MLNEFKIRRQITSNGSAANFEIGFLPQRVVVENLTRIAGISSTSAVVRYFWDEASGNARTFTEAASTTATIQGSIATNGIRVVRPSTNIFGARTAFASSTNASPVVVTSNGHGLAVGDHVLINSATGAAQIQGMVFKITAVTTNTFTICLNTPGSAATAGSFQKVDMALASPSINHVRGVSQATSAVVSLTSSIDYIVGNRISFSGFDTFGMTELNDLEAQITAVNTTNNTVTVDLDTSGFSPFSFPSSAGAGAQRPHIYPAGIEDTNFLDGSFRTNRGTMVILGSSVVGSSSDILVVTAENIILSGR